MNFKVILYLLSHSRLKCNLSKKFKRETKILLIVGFKKAELSEFRSKINQKNRTKCTILEIIRILKSPWKISWASGQILRKRKEPRWKMHCTTFWSCCCFCWSRESCLCWALSSSLFSGLSYSVSKIQKPNLSAKHNPKWGKFKMPHIHVLKILGVAIFRFFFNILFYIAVLCL